LLRHISPSDAARIRILVIQPHFQTGLLGHLHRESDAVEPDSRQIRNGQALPGAQVKSADSLRLHLVDLSGNLALFHIPVPKPERQNAIFSRRVSEYMFVDQSNHRPPMLLPADAGSCLLLSLYWL